LKLAKLLARQRLALGLEDHPGIFVARRSGHPIS
jgi:hypothetical protein